MISDLDRRSGGESPRSSEEAVGEVVASLSTPAGQADPLPALPPAAGVGTGGDRPNRPGRVLHQPRFGIPGPGL